MGDRRVWLGAGAGMHAWAWSGSMDMLSVLVAPERSGGICRAFVLGEWEV